MKNFLRKLRELFRKLAGDDEQSQPQPAASAPVVPPVIAAPAQPPAVAPGGVFAMHPLSNAYLFNPPPPDRSPSGYGLQYPVGRDDATGASIVAGEPWIVYPPAGRNFANEAEIEAWKLAVKARDLNLDREQERWKGTRYDGPVAVASMSLGDKAYAASRYGDYHYATGGRDLFRDLCAGTNPEIARAQHDGHWNMNNRLPFDPMLANTINELEQRYRIR